MITVQFDMHYFKDMYCGMQCSNVSRVQGTCPALRQPPLPQFLSQRQITDINTPLYFRYHSSPYQPNPSCTISSPPIIDFVSSQRKPPRSSAALAHSLLPHLPLPQRQQKQKTSSTNLDCSDADSSGSPGTSQQPQANSISEMRPEFTIMKELNAPAYAVFKPS